MKIPQLATIETIQAWVHLRNFIKNEEYSIRRMLCHKDHPVTKERIDRFRAAQKEMQLNYLEKSILDWGGREQPS